MDLKEFKEQSTQTRICGNGLKLKVYELMRKGKLIVYISGTEYFNGLSPGRYVRYVVNAQNVKRTNFMNSIKNI